MVKLKRNISFKKPKLKQIIIPLLTIAITTSAAGGFFVYKNIKEAREIASVPKLLTENKEPENQTEVKTNETTKTNEQNEDLNKETTQKQTSNTQNNEVTNQTTTVQPKTYNQPISGSPVINPAPAPAPKTAPAPTQTLNPTPAPAVNPLFYSAADAEAYVESRLFALVNAERQRVNVASLSYNSLLGKAAEIRVDEESSLTFADEDHTRPNGTSFSTVFREVGYNWTRVGENLFWGYQGATDFTSGNLNTIADKMFTGWKNSPGHYANMISGNYRETGFGVNLINANGRTYFFGIQEFGTR